MGKEEAAKQWVVWDHKFDFETRGLTRQDQMGLGAEEAEGKPLQLVEWNQANNWRIPREQLPLTDFQLGQMVAMDKSFRLVDH